MRKLTAVAVVCCLAGFGAAVAQAQPYVVPEGWLTGTILNHGVEAVAGWVHIVAAEGQTESLKEPASGFKIALVPGEYQIFASGTTDSAGRERTVTIRPRHTTNVELKIVQGLQPPE